MLIAGTTITMIASLLALVFGLFYLARPRFMTYHQKAVNMEWSDLEKEMQTLIMALMRAVGGGFLAVSFAMCMLQLEFIRHHELWVALTILITGLAAAFGAMFAVLLIKFRTLGKPPILFVIIFLILLLAGFFFNISV